ncbi:MAG: hemerythrin domain-containing protein, partial [Rhodocyclaceae bacterium]|nr:hemerythrin domain-containing protein [Rhodocyclaceae bacterium]
MSTPLMPTPGAGFDQPFELLSACHDRVQRSLDLLRRLQDHLAIHGADGQAQDAARDVLRYFDIAAPLHHDDEERHIFPA